MDNIMLENLKKNYQNIPIPDELNERVRMEIQKAKSESISKEERKIKIMKERKDQKSKGYLYFTRTLGGVAAAMFVITVMANSGATVAHAMEKVPVIGSIAKVVTFREYKSSTNDMEANVKVPEVSITNEDGTINTESTDKMNKSIEEYTNEIIKAYESDVEAAGGDGKLAVDVDYKVATDNDHLYSLRFDNSMVMAGTNQSVKIYHLDKKTGDMITLGDLFKDGSNYIDLISKNIKEQMKDQMAADESKAYWLDSEVEDWNFKSITEDATFYINDTGKLVVVFDEYEVAPGYMGIVEFKIPTEVVQSVVKDGFLK